MLDNGGTDLEMVLTNFSNNLSWDWQNASAQENDE